MRIVFDPDFDAGCWPGPLRGAAASAGEDWVGPGRFVQILETALGLGAQRLSLPERAADLVPAVRTTSGFWSHSAGVDPLGTARRLLEWRDMLALGGWRGGGREPRLAALAALTAGAAPGLPDRLGAVNERLARRDAGLESVELYAPRTDLEPLWQRSLDLLEKRGTRIIETPLPASQAPHDTDLSAARGRRFDPHGDGTLRLLRPRGPLAAADEVAAWLASLGDAPGTVIVGGEPVLDAALHRYGLPTTGASHGSRDSTPLQILPLVLDLGWRPQDPQRAFELLSLGSSPVPGELRGGLRAALQAWPAVDSDEWRRAMSEGLDAIEDHERRARVQQRMDVLWDAGVARASGYPAAEVARRVGMVRQWLVGRVATAPGQAREWGAALAQGETLLDLAQRSGLVELSPAQLRRLVVEATHGTGAEGPFPAEAGLQAVGQPGGVAGAASCVVWWRFDETSAPGVTRLPLTRAERAELEALGVALPEPGHAAAAHARRWRRPLEQATRFLLLVCPETDSVGEALFPHPLWDELVSRVPAKNTRRVAEHALMRPTLAGIVRQSRRELLPLPAPRREWSVPRGCIPRREKESPSSVETLLGCPFQWALRYVGRLRGADPAQVEDGASVRLLGELLHAIMNRLFAGPPRSPAEAEREAAAIFDLEGPRLVAPLFLPGADSQRGRVRLAAMRTASVIYGVMESAGLRVVATEQTRAGRAMGTAFEGRVDLVLGDPPRILDLKWSGAGRRRRALAEGTAIQLASYSFLERGDAGPFPPVGYFIMDVQRLLTTEQAAFHGAEPVDGPPPGETWRRLEATHELHWQQVHAGRLEARGVVLNDEQKPSAEARVVEDRIEVPPACPWCDFSALCGRAFGEDA